MKCTIPPKIRQIQPVVSEEFANTHTYIHTNIQRGYGYYNIDLQMINKVKTCFYVIDFLKT